MVSPAASFTSSAHPGPTDQLNPQHTHTPGLAAQPRDQIQSHEEKGASQQPHSAADDAAAALGVSHGSAVSHGAEVSHDGGGEAGEEAAGQSFTWGNSTGISELGGLEMTGRSASKSGTRRRKVAASTPESKRIPSFLSCCFLFARTLQQQRLHPTCAIGGWARLKIFHCFLFCAGTTPSGFVPLNACCFSSSQWLDHEAGVCRSGRVLTLGPQQK